MGKIETFKTIIFSLLFVGVVCFSTVGAVYVVAKYPLKDILSISLTPLIAMIAAWIAYQQHVTNRAKVNLDLYDKRIKIYNDIVRVISRVLAERKVDYNALDDFNNATEESLFLFDDEEYWMIEEIYLKLTDLMQIQDDQRKGNDIGNKQVEALEWLDRQIVVLKVKLRPYMSFKDFKSKKRAVANYFIWRKDDK